MEPREWSDLARALRAERKRLADDVAEMNAAVKATPDGDRQDGLLEAMGFSFQTMAVLNSLENVAMTMAGGYVET